MTFLRRRLLPVVLAALPCLALSPAAHAGRSTQPVTQTLVGTVDVAHGDDLAATTTTAYAVLRTATGSVRSTA